jgi:translation initiation factor 1 (eIF-1/SUI1)
VQKTKLKETPSMVTEELYGFPKSGPLTTVLEQSGVDRIDLWTRKDIQLMLNEYFAKHELVSPKNKRMIIMNIGLFHAIRSKSDEFDELERDAVVVKFCDKLVPHHVIQLGEERVVRKGILEPIRICVKKRQNRMVTLLWGVEPFGIALEELMERLKLKCASAATCIAF